MPRKSPYPIVLDDDERAKLESMAQKYTAPHFSVVRARIVLLAAQGLSNDQIAAKVDSPRQIVSKWRKRFFEERLNGLSDHPRSGRPARFSPQHRNGS
jgi:hypothetical protein